MAKSNGMVHGPATPIAKMPASYKSSTAKTYDGVKSGPAGAYKRTSSSNAVPEVTQDSGVQSKGGV
jgi:hypothetical protein